ncbi:hypothetical protein BJX70DRAFT_374082 [Aspergillus crustosus]
MQKSDHCQLPCNLGFGSGRVGTFSCLMNTTRSRQNHQLTWVCPSAGHLIDDLASEFFVEPNDTNEQQHSIDDKPSFRDDCAFFLVQESDLHAFQRVFSNINPFYMIPDLPSQVDRQCKRII